VPAKEAQQWCVDVVFVGTYEPPRARLLEVLVSSTPIRCRIYGSQWDKLSSRSPSAAVWSSGSFTLTTLPRRWRGEIALGFLRKENRDDYTQRTFEVPACGGVLVAERTSRHLSFYQEGKEAEFFAADDPGELCSKVATLLRDDARRELIRAAGQAALYAQRHTYQDAWGG